MCFPYNSDQNSQPRVELLVVLYCYLLQLSVDDLSRYGDAYGVGHQSTVLNNLRTAVEAANTSLVLPSVSSPTSALTEYIKNSVNGKVVEISSAGIKLFSG